MQTKTAVYVWAAVFLISGVLAMINIAYALIFFTAISIWIVIPGFMKVMLLATLMFALFLLYDNHLL